MQSPRRSAPGAPYGLWRVLSVIEEVGIIGLTHAKREELIRQATKVIKRRVRQLDSRDYMSIIATLKLVMAAAKAIQQLPSAIHPDVSNLQNDRWLLSKLLSLIEQLIVLRWALDKNAAIELMTGEVAERPAKEMADLKQAAYVVEAAAELFLNALEELMTSQS